MLLADITFKAVQSSAHESESLVKLCLVPVPVVAAPKVDAAAEEVADHAGGGRDA